MKIELGMSASIERSFSHADIENFAKISEDYNPLHLDKEFAKTTVFGKNIVHGMLVSSLFSGLLGTQLPGKGTIYLGQEVRFKKPVFVDELVCATIKVINIREDKPIIRFETIVVNSQNEIVVEGEATVLYKSGA